MKERDVVFAPEARDDLLHLYEWLAAVASPATALSYIERIETFCTGLSIGSERGHSRDDIRSGLRIMGFERRLTVAFSVEDHRVVILRLFYGGRNWEDLMR